MAKQEDTDTEDHAIVLRGIDADAEIPEEVKERIEYIVSDDAWEMAFLEPDEVEWVEGVDI